MIPTDVFDEILLRLDRVEREERVRILLAVESGSRAWGFASPDSDFDVRFIYARDPDWYLSVDFEDQRDVIEYPIVDDIDLNGWDVRKALRLFWRSNPAFCEWIQSPIRYREAGAFAERARALLPAVYSGEAGIHHYLNMARTNHRDHLRGDSVRLKKYFYALRPLLAVRWIEQYRTAPPIEFARLLPLLEGQNALLGDIAELLRKKSAAPELGRAAPVPALNAFIEAELARGDEPARDDDRPISIEELNRLFRAVIREVPPATDEKARVA